MKISVKGMNKSFADGQPVLKGIGYEDEVDTLAIIGPSGSGKSTFLRILAGLIPPDSGEITVGEQRLDFSEKALIEYRRTIGFVFQSRGLFAHLSAFENIVLPLVHVHRYNRTDAEKTADNLLQRFGLSADGHKRPSELSGGQQQRIAIARAIAPKPKLLLLDEPTSALDPELTSEVLDMVNELKNENLSIMVVTHEMGFAKNACRKAIFLHGGEIKEAGLSEELFRQPRTEELKGFLGKVLEWKI